MFALFYSLYYSMFIGTWTNSSKNDIQNLMTSNLNTLGRLITSIFNDSATPITDLGSVFSATQILQTSAFVLALITSIGIVVMAVKGVKRAFGIFFGQIR